MGVLDKFKNIVGIGDDDFDDEDYITEEEIEEAEKRLEKERMDSNRFSSSSKYSTSPRESANVVPMGKLPMGMNVVIMEPKVLDEAQQLVDSLKQDKPVIINLNSSSPENGRKIFDFLSGATYALAGSVQKIEDNIFIFAPRNISVSDRTEKGNSGDGNIDFSGIDSILGGK